jgi:hypothetical protein
LYNDSARGWETEEVWFNFQQGQNILLHYIQTASHAHPASYSVTTGDSYTHGQTAMHLITHVCYVLRLRMSAVIPPSFIYLHAMHTNKRLLLFWQIIYNREPDGKRERESMHVQLPVLCLMISFKLFLSERYSYCPNLDTLFMSFAYFHYMSYILKNRHQKNHHQKENHFTAHTAIIFLYNVLKICAKASYKSS